MNKQTGIRLFFAHTEDLCSGGAGVPSVFLGKKAYSFGYQVVSQEAVSRPPGKDVAVTLDNGNDRRGTGRASGGQGPGA